MYYALNNEFFKQTINSENAEKKYKQESETRQLIMKMNMENLEKCIKKNSIDELDRTKPYDKTFICGQFISKSGDKFMQADEIQEFAQNFKPLINNQEINYINNHHNYWEQMIEINKDIKEYKFWSTFIPKDTFTNISGFLVFRISNDKSYISKNMMQINEVIL